MCSTWVKFSDVVAGGDSGVTLYMVITVAAGLVGEGESSPKQMCWESTIVWVETRESAFIGWSFFGTWKLEIWRLETPLISAEICGPGASALGFGLSGAIVALYALYAGENWKIIGLWGMMFHIISYAENTQKIKYTYIWFWVGFTCLAKKPWFLKPRSANGNCQLVFRDTLLMGNEAPTWTLLPVSNGASRQEMIRCPKLQLL